MEQIFETRSKLAVFCNGKQISPYKFTNVKELNNGYLVAYNSSSFTIYDSNGISILSKKMIVESISYTSILVLKNEFKGVYRFDGKLIVPAEFDDIYFEDEGIIVEKDGLYGLYSYEGTLIIPVEFDVFYFYDKGIIVKKDGLYGVYSYEGTRIVPVEFDDIYFEDEGITVEKDGLYGVYSYEGTLTVPVEFFDISITHTGIIEVLKEENGFYEVYQE